MMPLKDTSPAFAQRYASYLKHLKLQDTHLTTQTEALASQRIDALMDRFNLGWGAVK